MTGNRNDAIDRRMVVGLAAGAVAAPFVAKLEAKEMTEIALQPVPLGFDPASVAGLSERLLASHHQNNYGGALKRLVAIETEMAAIPAAAMPGYRLNGLKREQLIAHNSVVLHEIYFAGLAGDAAPAKTLSKAIDASFGSFDAWRNEFAAMGKALGGGSGWVLLTWSARRHRLVNAWAADHTMTAADGTVLVALDMYEHAYALDYGANAGAYVDASVAALRWTSANRAFDKIA